MYIYVYIYIFPLCRTFCGSERLTNAVSPRGRMFTRVTAPRGDRGGGGGGGGEGEGGGGGTKWNRCSQSRGNFNFVFFNGEMCIECFAFLGYYWIGNCFFFPRYVKKKYEELKIREKYLFIYLF